MLWLSVLGVLSLGAASIGIRRTRQRAITAK
jgi:hypothetical protein